MPQVTLGRTGIVTDKNGFGALPVQRVSTSDGARLLRRAFDAGFTFFDTARAYTDSEEKIGLGLSEVRSKLVLATKTQAKTPEVFWEHLHESLRQMRTDYVDIMQFHMAAQCYRPGDGTGMYEAMVEAQRQGKIRFIGITAHKIGVGEEAVESGLYDTLQFPLCYLSSERDIRLAQRCKEKNVGFIAMKALSGGLITNAAAAYAWLNQYENVLPIWGIQRESELNEFVEFFNHPPVLDEEMEAIIAADQKELEGGFCRGCGYCLPCPAGIEINNCARMSQLIRRSPSEGYLAAEWQQKMAMVEQCMNCGLCGTRCPYELDTPTLLRQHYEDYQEIIAGRREI